MIENQVSMTALITAYIRACHANDGSPKILDDFLAESLI
jgi:O-methyltransferase involved in polyketide biosynthesis